MKNPRRFQKRLVHRLPEDLRLMPTDLAHVLTAQRADVLHQLQPNHFYTLPRSDNFIELQCVHLLPSMLLQRVNDVQRSLTETGVESHWRAHVRHTFALATRDWVQAKVSAELTLFEQYVWVGAVLAIGLGVACVALVGEWVW